MKDEPHGTELHEYNIPHRDEENRSRRHRKGKADDNDTRIPGNNQYTDIERNGQKRMLRDVLP